MGGDPRPELEKKNRQPRGSISSKRACFVGTYLFEQRSALTKKNPGKPETIKLWDTHMKALGDWHRYARNDVAVGQKWVPELEA